MQDNELYSPRLLKALQEVEKMDAKSCAKIRQTFEEAPSEIKDKILDIIAGNIDDAELVNLLNCILYEVEDLKIN